MTTRLLAILLTGLCLVSAAIPASAQSLAGVAVIDVQRLQRESAATKSINAQLEKLQASMSQDIAKQENELRSAKQELDRQRTLVSPEAFNERVRAFEQKYANLQRDVQNRKRGLEKSAGTAFGAVEKALREVVEQLVEERRLNLVIVKNLTMYNAPEYELTEEVIKRLNAKLPSVKVQPPAATPAPGAAPKPQSKPPSK
jgi:Skp family chaperone for outer membrane proteins